MGTIHSHDRHGKNRRRPAGTGALHDIGTIPVVLSSRQVSGQGRSLHRDAPFKAAKLRNLQPHAVLQTGLMRDDSAPRLFPNRTVTGVRAPPAHPLERRKLPPPQAGSFGSESPVRFVAAGPVLPFSRAPGGFIIMIDSRQVGTIFNQVPS